MEKLTTDWEKIKQGIIPYGPENKRSEIFLSIVEGEREYLRKLNEFETKYLKRLKNEDIDSAILGNLEIQKICINFTQLIEFGEMFLNNLENFKMNYNYKSRISEVFLLYINEFQEHYRQYFIGYPNASDIINSRFQNKNVINFFEKNFKLKNGKSDFLQLIRIPLNHIKTNHILIEELLFYTSPNDEDYAQLKTIEKLLGTLISSTDKNPIFRVPFDSKTNELLARKKQIFSTVGSVLEYNKHTRHVGKDAIIIVFERGLVICFSNKMDFTYQFLVECDIASLFLNLNSDISLKVENALTIISPVIEITVSVKEKNKLITILDDCLRRLLPTSISLTNIERETEFYFKTKIKYIGSIKKGNLNGYGKLIYLNGTTFEGNFKNNIKHGKGKLIFPNGFKIIGNWEKNVPHGFCELYFSDHSIYKGYFLNGQRNLIGHLTLPNNGLFKGYFINDLIVGKGEIKFPSGQLYNGSFKNGYLNEFGVFENIDGSVYFGNWENNLKSGKGQYFYSNGDVYYGNWYKNLRHGKGIFQTSTTKYIGEWYKDKQHGVGIFWYDKNHIYYGDFLRGARSGKGKYYSYNMEYEGMWSNNLPNGYGSLKIYSNDFNIIQSNNLSFQNIPNNKFLQNFQKLFLIFNNIEINNEKVKIKIVGIWKDGLPHGKIKYDVIGKLKYEGIMSFGQKSEKGKIDFLNGKRIITNFLNDQIQLNTDLIFETDKISNEKIRLHYQESGKNYFNQITQKIEDDLNKKQVERIFEKSDLWILPPLEITFINQLF
ncbi:hypothetical protein M0813_01941 [Anaeramoeba flamelloides]|uniref:DH domain-containing protein n=1 Tax=Anaeramoeba flamelloides TaxID=1746091 RepID=A0ABQ8YQ28_9EUKA|nr:hypothetical protein M0813_01941 [Anaeramoeba flamelloides]